MRTILFCLSITAFLACDNGPKSVETDMINIPDPNASSEELPQITFEQSSFDFGTIAEGEFVKHTFEFENTGNSPLVLTNVSSTCGCTVMKDWPKEPIAPGNDGEIVVEFNSENRSGVQNKTITVVANTYPAKTPITLTGTVVGAQTNQ